MLVLLERVTKLDLQTAQYGHRRHDARTETENGRVNSAAEPQ